ncbi:MAG TPA: TIGR03118 family protein [Terriglobales bacterium]|nr:TIGR03118 family protein [Terriglobales bacterium]
MKSKFMFCALVLAVMALSGAIARAQGNAYQQTNLVSDMAGAANHADPNLINPWGISFVPGQPFWISDNGTGNSTVYDASGDLELTVTIPAPTGDTSHSTPTGTVINTTVGFMVGGVSSQFLFVTQDGAIAGWNGTGNAIIAVDNSSKGSVYTGLALLSPSDTAPFLAAANFSSGSIEAYTQSFAPLAPAGSFTDPNLPAGYAPFNIQQVGNQVFVTYALQNSTKTNAMAGAGNGFVDIYDLDGNFVKRFVSNAQLNAPWGVVQASSNFGAFSNDILIGNFGDGTINAFDSATGNFIGQLQDSTGTPITNNALWALVFGAGGTGDSNTLYFTAGVARGHGLFGSIAAATSGTADFSVTSNPTSGTVTPGGSMNFAINVTPANGFASSVSFTCTAPSGFTCSLNPRSVTPASGAANTTLTVMAQTGVQQYSQAGLMAMLTGAGMFGCFFAGFRRKKRLFTLVLAAVASFLIAGTLLVSTACGGSKNSNNSSMNLGTGSIVVNATSGAVMHTTTISVTVQ